MKGIRHHVEKVRAKPHHVRKRVTLVAAGAIAGLIGAGWFGGSLAVGAFELHPTSFEQALAPQQPSFATTTTADSSNLAGAAAAFSQQQQSEPAHIVIISAPATTTAAATTTQTTIPF